MTTGRLSLHLHQSALTYDSRLGKISDTLAQAGVFDRFELVGIQGPDLPEHQRASDHATIWRVPLRIPRFIPKLRTLTFHLEWLVRVLRRYRSQPISVVTCHTLLALPAGVLLKRLGSATSLVYDAIELETEVAGMSGLRQRYARMLERLLIRHVDQVLTVSPSIVDWYERHYDVPVALIRNRPLHLLDEADGEGGPTLRERVGIGSGVVFLYVGGIMRGRGIQMMLDTFARAKPDRHIVFLGFGPLVGTVKAYASRYSNIHFHDAVPPSALVRAIRGADVGISLPERTCLNHYYCLPNKFYDYVQAGLAVLISDFPDMSAELDRLQVGWKVPVASDVLLELINSLEATEIEQYKRSSRRAAPATHWGSEARVLVDRYRRLPGVAATPVTATIAGPEPPVVACTRCILERSDDPSVTIDASGLCTQCRIYDGPVRSRTVKPEDSPGLVARFVEDARQNGRGRDYDCVIGVSGGVDSTYVALVVKRLGLRAIAVHLDNGWDSEMAVGNIEAVVTKLGFDLHTWVINWSEFRDLQLSYFKAGVVDLEVPTDHAIIASLFLVARRYGVRHIFTGHNLATEGFLPEGWVHNKMDYGNLAAIHRRFGTLPLRTFPRLPLSRYAFYTKVLGMQMIPILDYLPYVKATAQVDVEQELGWRDHHGKHFESIFTRFYQAHILPEKFGIDKRKSHLSTLINSGQLTRDEALARMKSPPYPSPELLAADREYVLKKLGFTEASWQDYLRQPRIPHEAYPSYMGWYRRLRPALHFTRRVRAALGGARSSGAS